MTTLTTEQKAAIAKEIFGHMGGTGRLKSMIGAKNFAYGIDSQKRIYITFAYSIKCKNKSKMFKVTLQGNDLYTVEFGKMVKCEYRKISKNEDFYADMLIKHFETFRN